MSYYISEISALYSKLNPRQKELLVRGLKKFGAYAQVEVIKAIKKSATSTNIDQAIDIHLKISLKRLNDQ